MRLPNLSANSSVYKTQNNYVGSFDIFPSFNPPVINPRIPFEPGRFFPPIFGSDILNPDNFFQVGTKCNKAVWSSCEADAQNEYNRCALSCDYACSPSERYPNQAQTAVCSACRRNLQYPDCRYVLQESLKDCRKNFGCPSAYTCNTDIHDRINEYCCPSGQDACNGVCLNGCPLPKRRNPITCECECPFHCRLPKHLNTETCGCECPTCPTGFIQNQNTCECYCPDGFTNCSGKCVNLQVERKNCGSCGNECSPNQDCCFGNCVSLIQDPNCGQCSNNCSAKGQTCCHSGGASRGYCSELNTNDDCGSCGTKCQNGRVCVNKSCICPTGRAECNGSCCPSNQSCCNGVCVSLNTTSNCGACGRVCQPGEGCCNGVCTSLNTTTNCGSCGKSCGTVTTCEIGTNNCTDIPLTCSQGVCKCPSSAIDCSIVGQDTFCCPPNKPVCSKLAPDGSSVHTCCDTGTSVALLEGTSNISTNWKCCPPERTLVINNIKTCCQPGKVPAIGGDTLNRVCCPNPNEILFDGYPRLIQGLCRYF